jgi:hypothetical protein
LSIKLEASTMIKSFELGQEVFRLQIYKKNT